MDRRGTEQHRDRHHETREDRRYPCDQQPCIARSLFARSIRLHRPSPEHHAQHTGRRHGEMMDRVKSHATDRGAPAPMPRHEAEERRLDPDPRGEAGDRDHAEHTDCEHHARRPCGDRQNREECCEGDREDRHPRLRRSIHGRREGRMGRDRSPPGNRPGQKIRLPEADRGPGLEMRSLRLGDDLDGVSDRTQPETEFHVLDRRPSERGIEATNRLEHISPNRTEAGPESRNRIASVLMNLMMSKVRIGGRDARSLRPIVVRADRRRDRGAGVRLSEWFEKAFDRIGMDEHVSIDEDEPSTPCRRGGEVPCDSWAHGLLAGANRSDPRTGITGAFHRPVARSVVDHDHLGRIAGRGSDRVDAA